MTNSTPDSLADSPAVTALRPIDAAEANHVEGGLLQTSAGATVLDVSDVISLGPPSDLNPYHR